MFSVSRVGLKDSERIDFAVFPVLPSRFSGKTLDLSQNTYM
jgi:hypothetical protein